MIDPCLDSEFEIDAAILNPWPYQYILEQAPAQRTLSPDFVSESYAVAICQQVFEFEITDRNDIPLALLAEDFPVSFDQSLNLISTETSDRKFLDQSPI